MKKSEMVERLAIPVSLVGGGLLTRDEIRETCAALIEILEKEGMLPPHSEKMRFVNQVYSINRLDGHRWEPEDEHSGR